MNEIKIGTVVKLLYWKDNKIHDFYITDIFFEAYSDGYKTIIKAKYYSEKSDCYFTETYFSNDFFKAMADATLIIEADKENKKKSDELPSCNNCVHNGEWSSTGNCIKCSCFDRYEKRGNK